MFIENCIMGYYLIVVWYLPFCQLSATDRGFEKLKRVCRQFFLVLPSSLLIHYCPCLTFFPTQPLWYCPFAFAITNDCLSTNHACMYCQNTSSTCIEFPSLYMAVPLSHTFSEPLIPFVQLALRRSIM